MRRRSGAPRGRATAARVLACAGLLLGGCSPESAPGPPDILWVVWDTVRADRMSLYGHERPTTPRLDAWAQGARVFEDVVSSAGYTVPSHASMLTGLLPSEHCADADRSLARERTTIAELLRGADYRTFLYSANPYISGATERNFAQGFDVVLHPWSPAYREEATDLARRRIPPEDRSSELPDELAAAPQPGRLGDWRRAWSLHATGPLAQRALLEWLESGADERPWFALLNYMEAHQPLHPPRRYRELFLAEKDVDRSLQVDRSWQRVWEYSFGLRDLSEKELTLTRATYDAVLRELDDLFAELLSALDERGYLEDTVVVLTSDHGEQLGEHHMLDHQYSLYEPLLRVPLLLHHPERIPVGRDARPVSNIDLFPTLLRLAGIEPPAASSGARDLLDPEAERVRLAENAGRATVGIDAVRAAHPDWDPSPFRRQLRAVFEGRYKYLWASDGRSELYDVEADPRESRNLAETQPAELRRLEERLGELDAGLVACEAPARDAPVSEAQRRRLEALGYLPPRREEE